MGFPVVINGHTYNESDFSPYGYVTAFPAILNDLAAVAAGIASFAGSGGIVPNGQLVFPGTQNPSSNANTLDDYEEGTFTPGWSFGGGTTGITYAGQFGYYIKVGRMVVVSGLILLSSKGSSTGAARMTGLPFATANVSNGYTPGAAQFGTMAAAISTFHALLPPNASTIDIYKDAGNTYSTASDADLGDSSHMFYTATYLTGA